MLAVIVLITMASFEDLTFIARASIPGIQFQAAKLFEMADQQPAIAELHPGQRSENQNILIRSVVFQFTESSTGGRSSEYRHSLRQKNCPGG